MTQPKRPELPAHIKRLDRTFRSFDVALACLNGEAMALAATGLLAHLTSQRTPAELAEEARYDREVKVWNAWVLKQRQARQAAQQVKKNAAEVAAVRRAACPRCFSTHAGEC